MQLQVAALDTGYIIQLDRDCAGTVKGRDTEVNDGTEHLTKLSTSRMEGNCPCAEPAAVVAIANTVTKSTAGIVMIVVEVVYQLSTVRKEIAELETGTGTILNLKQGVEETISTGQVNIIVGLAAMSVTFATGMVDMVVNWSAPKEMSEHVVLVLVNLSDVLLLILLWLRYDNSEYLEQTLDILDEVLAQEQSSLQPCCNLGSAPAFCSSDPAVIDFFSRNIYTRFYDGQSLDGIVDGIDNAFYVVVSLSSFEIIFAVTRLVLNRKKQVAPTGSIEVINDEKL